MADDSTTDPPADDGAGAAGKPATGAAGQQDPPPPAADTGLGDAGKSALDKERTAARDAQKALKAAQAELVKFREAQMTEQEKAVATARREADEAARADERGKSAGRLVAAEFRAVLAGRVDVKKLPDLLAGINPASFVTDDGDVDEKAVARFAEALAPARSASFDGGARGTPADGRTDMNQLIRRQAGIT